MFVMNPNQIKSKKQFWVRIDTFLGFNSIIFYDKVDGKLKLISCTLII